MVRRVVVTVAGIALVLGIGTVTAASTAEASVPTITANGSATCTNLGGVIHFTPPLYAAGTSNTESASFSVNLNSLSSGCLTTATNLPAGGILYGKGTATLTTTTTDNSANSCARLGQTQLLSMSIAWHYKNSSGATLAKLTPTTVSFSGFDDQVNGASEPGFIFPEAGGTSPSGGSFAGPSSDINVFGEKTNSIIARQCGRSTGLTSLKLGGAGTTADPSQASIGVQPQPQPDLNPGAVWTFAVQDLGLCLVETFGQGGTWTADNGASGVYSGDATSISETFSTGDNMSGEWSVANQEYVGSSYVVDTLRGGVLVGPFPMTFTPGAAPGC